MPRVSVQCPVWNLNLRRIRSWEEYKVKNLVRIAVLEPQEMPFVCKNLWKRNSRSWSLFAILQRSKEFFSVQLPRTFSTAVL